MNIEKGFRPASPEDKDYPASYKVADMLGIDFTPNIEEQVTKLEIGEEIIISDESGDKQVKVKRLDEKNYSIDRVEK
jgi:hypothetical protein